MPPHYSWKYQKNCVQSDLAYFRFMQISLVANWKPRWSVNQVIKKWDSNSKLLLQIHRRLYWSPRKFALTTSTWSYLKCTSDLPVSCSDRIFASREFSWRSEKRTFDAIWTIELLLQDGGSKRPERPADRVNVVNYFLQNLELAYKQ